MRNHLMGGVRVGSNLALDFCGQGRQLFSQRGYPLRNLPSFIGLDSVLFQMA